MAELSKLLLDEQKISEGVWVLWEEDIELLLAPMHNKRMEEYVRQKTVSNSRGGRVRRVSDELSDKITLEAISRHVLIGWKNLEMDGKEVEYSHEKAFELLSHIGLTHLYRFVLLTASDDAIFRAELEEEELGN
jgi:hypothetical protein